MKTPTEIIRALNFSTLTFLVKINKLLRNGRECLVTNIPQNKQLQTSRGRSLERVNVLILQYNWVNPLSILLTWSGWIKENEISKWLEPWSASWLAVALSKELKRDADSRNQVTVMAPIDKVWLVFSGGHKQRSLLHSAWRTRTWQLINWKKEGKQNRRQRTEVIGQRKANTTGRAAH